MYHSATNHVELLVAYVAYLCRLILPDVIVPEAAVVRLCNVPPQLRDLVKQGVLGQVA